MLSGGRRAVVPPRDGRAAASAVGAMGAGTNWKFDFQWSTAAGGGGTTEYSLKKLDEKSGKIFDDAVERMREAKESSKWDYSAFSYAATTLPLLADDVTGIGAIDDLAIPVAYTVAAGKFMYDNRALFQKMWTEIDCLLSKGRTDNYGFVYELRAINHRTNYLNVRTKQKNVELYPNEVWKIGQTTKGINRYSSNSYERKNFEMIPVFWGNTTEQLIYERILLYNYFLTHGHLPPGNHIFR